MDVRDQNIGDGIVVSALVVLTESEFNILESMSVRKRIDHIAKDLRVEWSIETGGNISMCAVSRTFGPVVGNTERHEVEMAAENFMKAIREINLPQVKEPECPTHEATSKEANAEKLAFVDSLIEDENLIRQNFRGIDVMAPYKGMPFAEKLCHMTLDTWFEILKTYSVFHHGD